MNLAQETEKFRTELVECINGSNVPVTVKRYVINDIRMELEGIYQQQLAAKESEEASE